jgi:hypothetical protein
VSFNTVAPVWRRIALVLVLAGSIAAIAWTYLREQQGATDDGRQTIQSTRPTVSTVEGVSPAAVVKPKDSGQSTDLVSTEVGTALHIPERIAANVLLDPFAPLAVAIPPPTKPVPAPAVVAPVAPPIPFQYMGKLEQQQKSLPSQANTMSQPGVASNPKIVVYLARGDESFSVGAGENVDANYRFVGIDGDVLVFTYLPLSQRQTLPIGP